MPTPLAIGDSTVYIHPRTEWADANPIVGRLDPMGRPACITVHHEGQDTGFMSQAAVCSHLRAIRSQQVKTKASGGLCAGDIAYHFIIDPSGTVWEGRPLQYQGAHAGNSEANRGNIGVCLLGEFDSQQVPYAQKKSLRAVLAMLMGRYAIPSGGILTHREVKRRFGLPPTQCPGDHLQAYVDGLRAELGLAHR